MPFTSGEPKAVATTISAVHSDIILTHILTRLDGHTLASTASTCSELHLLCSDEHLWANACKSTWPSTSGPDILHVISTFPNGSRSFFADSFPAPLPTTDITQTNSDHTPPQLISAVDLFHGHRLVFSKVVETETVTEWFRCSPFRVDLLDPKDVVKYPIVGDDDTCRDLGEDLRLSWIVIDPENKRAVNVSSGKAVTVQRHWLSGEVKVRFARVVEGEKGTGSEVAMLSVVVTWGGESMEEVREVSLEVEDMDGRQLNGRDSLVILQRALESERKFKGVEVESYREFVKMKKEREEERRRAERRLDMVCLCVGLAAAFTFVLWRW